jgi:hypothetical protein
MGNSRSTSRQTMGLLVFKCERNVLLARQTMGVCIKIDAFMKTIIKKHKNP